MQQHHWEVLAFDWDYKHNRQTFNAFWMTDGASINLFVLSTKTHRSLIMFKSAIFISSSSRYCHEKKGLSTKLFRHGAEPLLRQRVQVEQKETFSRVQNSSAFSCNHHYTYIGKQLEKPFIITWWVNEPINFTRNHFVCHRRAGFPMAFCRTSYNQSLPWLLLIILANTNLCGNDIPSYSFASSNLIWTKSEIWPIATHLFRCKTFYKHEPLQQHSPMI